MEDEMEQAIEKYKDPGPMSVETMKEQVNLIQHILKHVMKKGIHYGLIPGCGDKPTLFKAGAEKISLTFRLAPSYKVETVNMLLGHREVSVTCTLTHIPTGQVFGQGVGCCSTMEGKYRFRNVSRKCPECGAEAIIKGKEEYGGGWLCWAKREGCGAKFDEADPEIIHQDAGQTEHDNPADYYNTVLKMAKKRAHVDAVLTATAASDCFHQDIEDMPEVIPGAKGKQEPEPEPEPEPIETVRAKDYFNPDESPPPPPEESDKPEKVSKGKAGVLYAKLMGVPGWEDEDRENFLKELGVKSVYEVPEKTFKAVKDALDNYYNK